MGKRTITALFILLPIALFAQSKTSKVAQIKQVVVTINTDKTLTKVVLDNEYLDRLVPDGETPDNGEEVTGYFRADTLVKIVHWVGLSYCIKTCEIYLKSGKPVFVFVNQDNYHHNEKTGEMDGKLIKNVFEGRYYLDGKSLIQKVTKGIATMPAQEVLDVLKADMHQYPKLLFKERKKPKTR